MPSDMESRLAIIEQTQMEFRQAQVDFRQVVREIRDLGKRQVESLDNLVRLEERGAQSREALERAFKQIEKHQSDLDKIKAALPPLIETRRWVVSGMIGLIGIVLVALVGIVVSKPENQFIRHERLSSDIKRTSD